MRRIGIGLLWAGVIVGIASAAWLWVGPAAGGIPFLLGIGLIKLTFVTGLALISSGGVALRLVKRREAAQLPAGQDREAG